MKRDEEGDAQAVANATKSSMLSARAARLDWISPFAILRHESFV
ncbi:hypothetical protein AB3X82_16415 [Paraburkholderia phenoliruptrix]|uniref:Uncharacterized protein n=1 Tax=Paraburkholderia phenoliruptrix TaxID=252970 RepID=A0ABV3WEP5_9BURK|nr:hypothetical protein [Paraburkholderia phenoliruptrix]MDR6392091.1 hypothetical protein [Paraburkholderia phenoliruptrix]